MKGEIHYREKYPKELRIQIENEDELDVLRLIFNDSFAGILKRYKENEIRNRIEKDNNWKKRVTASSNFAGDDEPYSNYRVFEALENEHENIILLEDASDI